MRRREFIALMGASVALPFAAMAQQAGRTYRIGLLTAEPPRHPVQGGAFDALFDGLRRLGFFEGKNLEVHNRVYGQHPELLTEYVAELIKAKVDVIYASGPARIRAVQQATKTIPILGIAEDMLGSGLVTSLAHQAATQRASASSRTSLMANDRKFSSRQCQGFAGWQR